jgi:hypothetical protein
MFFTLVKKLFPKSLSHIRFQEFQMSVDMIFEIGFNHGCRNLVANQPAEVDNLSIKFSCNLLNEVTGYTESCLVEYFGIWARVLSFAGPDMDMKIVGEFPDESKKTAWNDNVMITNTAGPERIEAKYIITKVIIIETHEGRPNKYIEFDKKAKIVECKTVPTSNRPLEFPNYWMDHKRKYVDKNPTAFRPLTTITADVPVINVAVAFMSNSPPGPYKFSHPTAPYVRTHVQVCDLSFRQLRLAAIRGGGEDVPSYHLHIQMDENVEPLALPWLCVGDVLQVNTVKPVFAQRQTWNLLHKQKNFGETKIKIWPVEGDSSVVDITGKRISTDPDNEPIEIKQLRQWIRERLLKDSLLSDLHKGTLAGRGEWFSGRDLVARIERTNRYTNSLFITDFSTQDDDGLVEVRVRSSQQNFADALNYLFANVEKRDPKANGIYVLLRNLRVNSADNTLYCSVEHVTRVPEFCKDVQDLILRQRESTGDPTQADAVSQKDPTQAPTSSANDATDGFSFDQMIPSQWKSGLRLNNSQDIAASTQTGFVDSNSQVAFEFVDDDEECQSENVNLANRTEPSDEKLRESEDLKRRRIGLDD